MKKANNSGSEQKLLDAGGTKFVNDWSRDGRYLIYTEAAKGLDLMAVSEPLGGSEQKTFAIANSGFNETEGALSPDSRLVAYSSDESGKYEIYVRPFPPGDRREGKSLVSTAGGYAPRWRSDGKELYYIQGDLKLMAVDVQAGAAFQSMTPHALFVAPAISAASNILFPYDVTPDGKKFLLSGVVGGEAWSEAATVMQNWEAGLKK